MKIEREPAAQRTRKTGRVFSQVFVLGERPRESCGRARFGWRDIRGPDVADGGGISGWDWEEACRRVERRLRRRRDRSMVLVGGIVSCAGEEDVVEMD